MGRGLLVFKGEDKRPKSHSKTKKKSSKKPTNPTLIASPSPQSSSTPTKPTNPEPPTNTPTQSNTTTPTPTILEGTGLITSSGTIITGQNTQFTSEFSIGDALLLHQHPTSHQQEMRVITMLVSDISCAISSPFSTDLKYPHSFSYIRAPKQDDTTKQLSKEKAQKEVEQTAFGTYGSNTRELVYRKKTETGSYAIKRERLEREVGRGELLEMRSKKKSDKYC